MGDVEMTVMAERVWRWGTADGGLQCRKVCVQQRTLQRRRIRGLGGCPSLAGLRRTISAGSVRRSSQGCSEERETGVRGDVASLYVCMKPVSWIFRGSHPVASFFIKKQI